MDQSQKSIEDEGKTTFPMSPYYYVVGCLIGFICALILIVLYGYSLLEQIFSNWSQALPLVIALLLALRFSFRIDSRKRSINLIKTVYNAYRIFFIAVFIGCSLSYLLNGFILGDSFLLREISIWFFYPFVWINIVGIPSTLFVSLGYFFTAKFFRFIKASQTHEPDP